MGMAASQARLLTITARMHDVEYEAQSIQNAKTQLATQSDQIYNDYLEALDAQTLTFNTIDTNSGTKTNVAATFNNMCSVNQLTAANGQLYMLKNKDGQLIVDDAVYEAYTSAAASSSIDPYMLAMEMVGADLGENSAGQVVNSEETVVKNALEKNPNGEIAKSYNSIIDFIKSNFGVDDSSSIDYADIYAPANSTFSDEWNKASEDVKNSYDELVKSFQYKLYKSSSEEVYTNISTDGTSDDFNQTEFNYYLNVFKEIQLAGGCIAISSFNGSFGDAANNSDWLTSMVEAGQISIQAVNIDSKTGEVSMEAESPSSSSVVSYTDTTSIDSTAAKKAEAKYNHDLKEIDKKDTKYDLELSKLETERTALTTEYDSVKKVIEDNIERTFGIFS